ncbi:hypothetical protein [Candidatus Hodarchaeum mangrovi]
MPFGPFKKKKKKDLPNPPSFKTENEFQSPAVELKTPEPPKMKDFQKFSSSTEDYTSEKQGELQGPPRLEGPPKDVSGDFYLGPPKEGITSHPHLPTPPAFGSTIPSSPSSFNRSTEKQTSPLFEDEKVTEDILRELKQTSFGSDLEKAPIEKNQRMLVDEFNKRRLQETKRNYIAAGDKQLELKFYDNAATNFACAILLDLISEGYEAANQTKTDLSRRKPSAILDNPVFDSVRLIIEAVKTRNYTFFSRAEKNLTKRKESMYPEDAAIIENGIKAARTLLEL